jgi:hypothetical protein
MNSAMPTDRDLLQQTNETVLRMDAKLFDKDTGFVPGVKQTLASHSKRIRFLERLGWTIGGGLAVITFLIAHHLIAGVK